MLRKLLGFAFIVLGIVLEFMWLGFCFGSIIIGILLLVFAPKILFFPFNFFLLVGLRVMYADAFRKFEEASKNGYYKRSYSYGSFNNGSNAGAQNASVNKMDAYYAELESSPNDSFDVIKKNYRRLMKEHHYDSLVSKGLPKEMLAFSEEKTKRLNEAYAAIKEQRG